MGNSVSQRVNSPTSGLGFYLSYSVNKFLFGFFKQKSIFIPKNSKSIGLTVVCDSIPLDSNSNFIVLPPLIALQILYSAPGELWSWKHPKPPHFSASPRDRAKIPTSYDEITRSEEYTCVVSIKDGYPKMTHFYGNTVVGCHPIPRSMAAAVLGGDNHSRMYHGESSNDHIFEEHINNCYICRENKKQMNDTSMHKDDDLLCDMECKDDESSEVQSKSKKIISSNEKFID